MAFDDDERSVSSSRPIDLYQIQTPTQLYFLTSYVLDVTYAGQVYTATTMSRGTQEVGRDLTAREFLIYLPITHPIVQRYAAFGVPEHEVIVSQVRLQQVSGEAFPGWSGFVTTLTIDGGEPHVAVLRVPSVADDALKVRLPMIGAQVLCNHRLGDAQCGINLDFSPLTTTIVSISADGLTVILASAGPDNFHIFGNLFHIASQQRRMIIDQNGTTLKLSAPMIGIHVGDTVVPFPGCAHDIITCRDKFNNVANFGGHPDLNATINPWAPNGYGVIQQV